MTNVIPRSLFITDINDLSAMTMGGFARIFKGEYKGQLVALKLPIKTRHLDVSQTPSTS